jgi:hypothetical protein
MKGTFRNLSLNAPVTWNHQVKKQLRNSDAAPPIASAAVVLERLRDPKTAFRVKVRLEVLEPGFHAADTSHKLQALLLLHSLRRCRGEAIGHRLQATLLKAGQYLEKQVRDRQHGRGERGRSKLLLSGLANGIQTGRQAEG